MSVAECGRTAAGPRRSAEEHWLKERGRWQEGVEEQWRVLGVCDALEG
jgi:hypothetical protein